MVNATIIIFVFVLYCITCNNITYNNKHMKATPTYNMKQCKMCLKYMYLWILWTKTIMKTA